MGPTKPALYPQVSCGYALSLSPGVMWELATGFGEVRQDSASDERLTHAVFPARLIHLRSTQLARWTSRPSPTESAMKPGPSCPSVSSV